MSYLFRFYYSYIEYREFGGCKSFFHWLLWDIIALYRMSEKSKLQCVQYLFYLY